MRKFNTGATRDTDQGKYELFWAAGFYDGEGSVCCTANNRNPNTRIQLSIGQKNLDGEISDTLERFKNAVGVGKIYRKTRIGREINQHQYLVCKELDVRQAINMLYPLICRDKQRQMKRALELLEEGKKKLYAKRKNKNVRIRSHA